MKVEIYPLDRVKLDGKSVSLGMKRAEVEASIGAGQVVRGNEYYYCWNCERCGAGIFLSVYGNQRWFVS